ncbi:MAG TPA: 2-oxoglutarate dehydrogenase, E2 component, dihydrolipoamide succinyltransferase, partial [Candidatus Limnocylindria bacterium]|nr:2-oxoglutarate dehydrogenase, E2 component, dihydrolipoamide succinyltransferase [Candidatus Limnocylindria bacterium]
VDTEIPSPVAGVLLSIDVAEDETVAVGTVLARIGSAGAAAPAAEVPASPATPAVAQTQPAPSPFRPGPSLVHPPAPPPAPASAPSEPSLTPPPAPTPEAAGVVAAPAATADEGADGTYVTPLVRKLAAEHSVDLTTVVGSGVGGRIRKQDVLETAAKARTAAAPTVAAPAAPSVGAHAAPAPAAAPSASPLRGRTEKMSRLRRVIAGRMVASLQTSAQLTTVIEVDVSRIASLRQRAKGEFEAREGVKLSFLPFFSKATVEALKVFPQLNASIDTEAGTVTYHESEHLGVAVDTERGLLVPVIRDAGDLNIAGLARKITDLAERTRNNKITPDDLSGGTFTLTNTGSRGALFDTPIINQPQVAILGTGAVVRRPVVVTDETGGDVIAVRSMVYLALTYDHRLVDGADAARFLNALKTRLEEGAFESDLGL